MKWPATMMIAAVIASVGLMLLFAPAIGRVVTNHPTLKMLALSFLMVVGVVLIGVMLWQQRETPAPPVAGDTDPRTPTVGQNPLAFASSLQMALAFQVVLFAIAWVQQAVGTTGVLLSATLLGLTDVDALTMSMTRYGADPTHVRVAAAAIGIGVLSNTMLKLALVVSIGGPRFRARAAAGLLMLATAAAVGIWIGWP